ncbi:MAG: phosphatidate cytidylyltransferase [Acetobacteraceae bacterium]|nr:phosphatidate cytidylyltransferase [Acetobacteraceae bacterium]
MRGANDASVRALADSLAPPPGPATEPSPENRWGDLAPRVASALVLVPLALVCIWQGGAFWAVLVTLATVGLGWEWGRLTDFPTFSLASVAIPSVTVLSIGLAAAEFWLPALTLIAVSTLVLGLSAGWLALGLPYIAAAALGLIWLRADPAVGLGNLLFAVLIVWASDIGAYLAGRLLGGRKLAPAISPGKTISGALGGLAAAGAVGLAVAYAFSGTLSGRAALLAVALGVVAEAGDLLESWIKRRCGKKDSSHLIPGHGGLLDRLDALLAVAPVAAVLAFLLGRGAVLW